MSTAAVDALLGELDRFVCDRLTAINRAILAGQEPPEALMMALNEAVLPRLPPPQALFPVQAQALLVLLGFMGSSVGRHFQERDLSLLDTPEVPLQRLAVGADSLAFPAYVARIAERTGTGHPPRDAYASLVRWNVPTVEVIWHGERIAVLPGVFAQGVRTYTGDPGEVLFLTLLKKAEAAEKAANDALLPLSDGRVRVASEEGTQRMRRATGLLMVVYEMNLAFTAQDEHGKPIFAVNHFLDVLRQFAVHWRRGDVPPSGAQDPEFLIRDFLLGISFPDYQRHVKRVYPALLHEERELLETFAHRPTIPVYLLKELGLSPETLPNHAEGLRELLRRHPALAAAFLLLRANAKVSSSHLGLTKRFLFNPARARDTRGIPDRPLVSNRAGTTGLMERLLERLAEARMKHTLSSMARLPLDLIEAAAGGDPTSGLRRDEMRRAVRLLG